MAGQVDAAQPVDLPDNFPIWTLNGMTTMGAIRRGQSDIGNPITLTPALVERMKALVLRVGAHDAWSRHGAGELRDEARAISALMEPVDPDLLEARKVAAPFIDAMTIDIMEGGHDSSSEVEVALTAIRRGRSLALAERGEG